MSQALKLLINRSQAEQIVSDPEVLIWLLPMERDRVTQILYRVMDKVGMVVLPFNIAPLKHCLLEGDLVQMGVRKYSNEEWELGFAPGITQVIPERGIEAILAHELGHIAAPPDLAGMEAEKWADIFTARHGYGPDLASVLELTEALYTEEGNLSGFVVPDTVHPDNTNRAQWLTGERVRSDRA